MQPFIEAGLTILGNMIKAWLTNNLVPWFKTIKKIKILSFGPNFKFKSTLNFSDSECYIFIFKLEAETVKPL